MSNHSGELVLMSPNSSAKEHCKACETCSKTKTDTLPVPYSKLAKCRSDTSAANATALRVMPFRERKLRTRSPSAIKNGLLKGSSDSPTSTNAVDASVTDVSQN
jgi:hypothetical protein